MSAATCSHPARVAGGLAHTIDGQLGIAARCLDCGDTTVVAITDRRAYWRPPANQTATAVAHPKENTMSKSTTKRQGGISLTRLFVACCTLGLSIPFIGVRRVRKTTTRTSA